MLCFKDQVMHIPAAFRTEFYIYLTYTVIETFMPSTSSSVVGWGTMLQAGSRKVTGSNPDGVIGFFNWPNPSSRTIALGSTQPVIEMSTK
jgi:hypothetical protein